MSRILLILLSSLLVSTAARPAFAQVKISGVLFRGSQKGDPEPDSAIRLSNPDPKKAVRVGGYVLTDEKMPRSFSANPRVGGGGMSDQTMITIPQNPRLDGPIRLPPGTMIPAGGRIWLAFDGTAFEKVFGYPPDFESQNSRSDVPDLLGGGKWPRSGNERGALTLKDDTGAAADFVAWDVAKVPRLTEKHMPEGLWKGPPVRGFKSSFYGWRGQILRRDHDEQGRMLPDTDSEADWDSGWSKKQLGEEPTHRIELIGQSDFVTEKLKGVNANVLATSAPDNNYAELIKAIESARSSIKVSVYQFTNSAIADAMMGAQARGVKVQLWLEGAPVGGIPDQERYLVDKMHKRGISVHFLGGNKQARVKPRYRFDHSKYVIIDDKRAIIGTENYGRTGVPKDSSFGNRGWMIHIENGAFLRQLKAVWDHDYKPNMLDVISIDDDPNDAYGLPYRDPEFTPDLKVIKGLYGPPAPPVYMSGKVDLELVLSPDTCLNENSALIGMINRAKKTLLVQQNSIRRRWGQKSDNVSTTPDLPLEAILNAARRGVKVRVLLDGTWYNVRGQEDRDNDDTVRTLNALALEEGLDISAKIINLKTTHLEKIHAKGLIVDGREVFVGSINWTENSFKGNREVGVVIGHKKIAGYYEKLFWRDWKASEMYRARIDEKVSVRPVPLDKGTSRATLRPGEDVAILGEHGRARRRWLEIAWGRRGHGFIPVTAIGVPQATPNEGVHLIGRTAVIEGTVTKTHVTKKVIQLRFGDETHPIMMAVIFRRSEDRFKKGGLDPASAYQGRKVRIEGTVQTWHIPEVVLSRPTQIEILK